MKISNKCVMDVLFAFHLHFHFKSASALKGVKAGIKQEFKTLEQKSQ